MKSPKELAKRLTRQWQKAPLRVARLMSKDDWPLRLSIGKPTPAMLDERPAAVQSHIQRWKNIKTGQIIWQKVAYRATAEPVELPIYWCLQAPSQWLKATDDEQAQQDFALLEQIISQTDRKYWELLVRERSLWQNKAPETVIKAAQLVDLLQPGAAKGKPLRLLHGLDIDTKFFERNTTLLTRLFDLRYDGMASKKGLAAFLNAPDNNDHWLLVMPLAPGLLTFSRQRVAASELTVTGLPCSRLLVVENEHCMHLLPNLPDTIAVLGAGLNLKWLSGLANKNLQVAYWGDMDTWGLQMLSLARQYLPAITPLMMSETHFLQFAKNNAVPEPSHAQVPNKGLTGDEIAFFNFLKTQQKGRLEQEYLPLKIVQQELQAWLEQTR